MARPRSPRGARAPAIRLRPRRDRVVGRRPRHRRPARLPEELVEWRLDTVDEVVDAIRTLAVRGAPAIGIAGGLRRVVGLADPRADPGPDAASARRDAATRGRIGRRPADRGEPPWAVGRVTRRGRGAGRRPSDPRRGASRRRRRSTRRTAARCAAIAAQRRVAARRSAPDPDPLQHRPPRDRRRRHGAGDGLRACDAAGDLDGVIADEARPLLQGGRLTAWELAQAGVPTG